MWQVSKMAPQRRGLPRKGDTPMKAGKAWKTRKNRRILPKGGPRFEPVAEEPAQGGTGILRTHSRHSRIQQIYKPVSVRFMSPVVAEQMRRRTGSTPVPLTNRNAGDPVRLCEPANQAMAIPGTSTQNKMVLDKHEPPPEGDLPVPRCPDVVQEQTGYTSSASDDSSDSLDSSDSQDSSDSLAFSDTLPSPEILRQDSDGGESLVSPQFITGFSVMNSTLNSSGAEHLYMQPPPPNVYTILGSPTVPAEKHEKRSFVGGTEDQHDKCSGLLKADTSLMIKMPKLNLKPIKIKTRTHPASEPGETCPQCGHVFRLGVKAPHAEPAKKHPIPEPAKNRPEPDTAAWATIV